MTVTVYSPVDQVIQFHGHGGYDRMVVPDLRVGKQGGNNTAGDQRRHCAPARRSQPPRLLNFPPGNAGLPDT